MLLAKTLGSTKVTITFTNGNVRNMTLYVYEKPKSSSLSVQWLEDSYRPASGKYTVDLRVKNRCKFKITSATIRVDAKLSNGKKRAAGAVVLPGPPTGWRKETDPPRTAAGAAQERQGRVYRFHFDFT